MRNTWNQDIFERQDAECPRWVTSGCCTSSQHRHVAVEVRRAIIKWRQRNQSGLNNSSWEAHRGRCWTSTMPSECPTLGVPDTNVMLWFLPGFVLHPFLPNLSVIPFFLNSAAIVWVLTIHSRRYQEADKSNQTMKKHLHCKKEATNKTKGKLSSVWGG